MTVEQLPHNQIGVCHSYFLIQPLRHRKCIGRTNVSIDELLNCCRGLRGGSNGKNTVVACHPLLWTPLSQVEDGLTGIVLVGAGLALLDRLAGHAVETAVDEVVVVAEHLSEAVGHDTAAVLTPVRRGGPSRSIFHHHSEIHQFPKY